MERLQDVDQYIQFLRQATGNGPISRLERYDKAMAWYRVTFPSAAKQHRDEFAGRAAKALRR